MKREREEGDIAAEEARKREEMAGARPETPGNKNFPVIKIRI
jgi:hypothetical protein